MKLPMSCLKVSQTWEPSQCHKGRVTRPHRSNITPVSGHVSSVTVFSRFKLSQVWIGSAMIPHNSRDFTGHKTQATATIQVSCSTPEIERIQQNYVVRFYGHFYCENYLPNSFSKGGSIPF